jgi:uncharacterized delta-60 repeat protein
MIAKRKINGKWRDIEPPYIKVSDSWQIAKSAWVKIDDKWKSWFLQGGLNDFGFADFEDIFGANNTTTSIAIQPDGKILVGGTFTTFNDTIVNRIARLNVDGTLDTAFTSDTGTGPNSAVYSIAIQSDGKIVLGGSFTTFNGTTVNRIVRLNSDGTLDTAFTTNTGTGANSDVRAIAIQSDGKIVLGGSFTTFNGTTVNRIVRLNSDGTIDTGFNTGTGPNSAVYSIAIQPDGKILIGGFFSTFNDTIVNRIARLNVDGTLDTAFASNTGTGPNFAVDSIAIQPDGKILIGGDFTLFNDTTVNSIARLNADGTLDTAFTSNTGTGANNIVYEIAIQPDGKILIGGDFTLFNDTTVNSIVRLNSDGTLDTAFTTNTGTGANSTVWSIAIQSDGKILIGGDFTEFNGINRSRLARIGGESLEHLLKRKASLYPGYEDETGITEKLEQYGWPQSEQYGSAKQVRIIQSNQDAILSVLLNDQWNQLQVYENQQYDAVAIRWAKTLKSIGYSVDYNNSDLLLRVILPNNTQQLYVLSMFGGYGSAFPADSSAWD